MIVTTLSFSTDFWKIGFVFFLVKKKHGYFFFIFAINSILLFFALPRNAFLFSFGILIIVSHVFMYRNLLQFRAAIAYTLVLLAFVVYGRKKNKTQFSFFIFLACGFHISSILAFLAIFLERVNLTTVKYILLIVFSIVLGKMFNPIMIGEVSVFFPGGLQAAVNTYFLVSNEFSKSLPLANPTTIKTILLFILMYYLSDKNDFFSKFMLDVYFLSLCFLLAFASFGVFASRGASLFSFVEVILLPVCILRIRTAVHRLIMIILLLCSYGVVFYLNVANKNMLDSVYMNLW
ncbi:EpsG family protein [Vibrio parahaemolyticus]|nr:EpsG family protein [Vibrio parahaemolyticus]